MRPDTFSEGSVTNRNDYEPRTLDGQHVVIHLATESGTEQSMYEIEKYTSVNIAQHLVDAWCYSQTQNTVERVATDVLTKPKMLIAVCGSEVPWR